MEDQLQSEQEPEQPGPVKLDHHDSVRSHVCRQILREVERLEQRIESLRVTDAPHAAIMIASYRRMIDRKKGFLRKWNLQGNPAGW